MTADTTRPAVLTDEQLGDILRFVARTCLEVERGLRPPAHLHALMDPAQRWAQPPQLGRFRGGPVQDDQIGRPQISRLTDTHIVATVTTRTEANRWGALTLRLRATGARWRVADLHRLLAATHYRTPPTVRAGRDVSPEVLSERLAEERRLAHAAHSATRRRLGDLNPDAPGYRAARDLDRYWKGKLTELDRELAVFSSRQQTREHVERILRR